MILTTTPTVEGHSIREYRGIVCGEVVAGVNFIKDFTASIRNFIRKRIDRGQRKGIGRNVGPRERTWGQCCRRH